MTLFWLVYVICIGLAAIIAFRWLSRRFSKVIAALCIILIALPLLVPFNVPSPEGYGDSFSPAWIAAVFEHLQGDFDRSRAAIKLILLVECSIALALLAAFVLRRKASQ